MDKINRINDLIEGVDLNSSTTTLASAYIQETPKPSFSKLNKKDVVPVVMKPTKTRSGDVQYDVYVEQYHPTRDTHTGDAYAGDEDAHAPDDENKMESFTDYENSANYAPYKNATDFVTQFYVASLTVVGLYIFFKLVQRSR